MQAASWLLVQRAVHDGDMEPDQAASSRYRLGSKEICLGAPSEHGVDLLPEALRDLLARSDNLYRRIAAAGRHPVCRWRGALAAYVRRARASRPAWNKPSARLSANTISENVEREEPVFRVAPEAPIIKMGASAPGAVRHQMKREPAFYDFTNPANFLLKRVSRPPRSISCCWPPVQAGMGGGVDVERELLARLAIGGAGPIGRAVVQLDVDKMIVGVDALFHGNGLFRFRSGRLIGKRPGPGKRRGILRFVAWISTPYISPGTVKDQVHGPRRSRNWDRLSGRPVRRSLAPLRRVLPFLRPYRGRIAIGILASGASPPPRPWRCPRSLAG